MSHTSDATDNRIVTRALALLAAGVLPSVLPARLMTEFNLSSERARHLARLALERAASEKR